MFRLKATKPWDVTIDITLLFVQPFAQYTNHVCRNYNTLYKREIRLLWIWQPFAHTHTNEIYVITFKTDLEIIHYESIYIYINTILSTSHATIKFFLIRFALKVQHTCSHFFTFLHEKKTALHVTYIPTCSPFVICFGIVEGLEDAMTLVAPCSGTR